MKSTSLLTFALIVLSFPFSLISQDKSISPSLIITGLYHGETPPLRDIPALTNAEWQILVEKAERKMLNPKLRTRSYPFAETALPKGPDPVWQQEMGAGRESRGPIVNFNGQDSPYFPPDANGTAGPNHYMQTINSVYAIYNKTETLVAGPANMNTLFTGVTGASCNDGDPLVLFDEQADRWLAVEFSICGSNDYMLIAVSTTNDPTGTWHKYSFDVADMPDYEKFGIWQDGYYMGTNNSSGNDIYVFERSKMLLGLDAQAVGFNNPWRPTTIDGFMCVPPLDNDGTFAPAGEPGLFITLNDDAIGGGSDQLWIYELDVDWVTPANSTFTRSQQLAVAAFDSNFGNNWDNIKQLGTSQELDAIPQVIMNPPQYRNFGAYETIVCCHTVDVDATDHAGIRWYELRRVSSGDWTIRQQGTYAPDGHSRWMGSMMLNGQNEIGLGYSVSSSTMYPAIRYCGQSSAAYSAANGILDVAEESIQAGVYYQSSYNRWGDYSALQVDPADDHTFWFTTEYIGSGGSRKTKIASFTLSIPPLTAAFSGNPTSVCTGGQVAFTDQSLGLPTSWAWTFPGGTPATSNIQNPTVTYNSPGVYDVSLTVGDGNANNSLTKTGYINVSNITANFSATQTVVNTGNTVTFADISACNPSSWNWSFPGGTPSSSTNQNPVITYNTAGIYSVTLIATNANGNDTEIKTNFITVIDCSNFPLPFSEDFSDGALPTCWTIVDNQGNGQVWQFNNPGGVTVNTATAANGFAILDSDNYGSGNTQNADLITPDLNFSSYTNVSLTFQHYFVAYSGSSASLHYSVDGGNTWSLIQTWTTTTVNAATFSQDLNSQVGGQANVRFKWNYTGTWGYHWAVDDISITGSGPNQWIGISSVNWNTPTNWSNNEVPNSASVVSIPASAPNWPSFSGDIIIGTNCSNLILNGSAQMTVTGNFTVNPGYSVIFDGNGTLSIGGDWANNGTFSPGSGIIKFTGNNPASVIPAQVGATITTYQRSTFAKSMTALTDATSGPSGDDGNVDIPIGFTFNYCGGIYTQAKLSTNGWLSLNQTGTLGYANLALFDNSAPNATLAPWWDDLTDDATSSVSYKTEGVAPNRIFTAEWYRVPTYFTGATSRISFQVKLYETTNVLEFHYGSYEPLTNYASEGASIGVEDAVGGINHFIEATTGSNTTEIINLVSSANWPAVNYRFAPLVPDAIFQNIIINKNGSYVDFNTNTVVNNSILILPGSAFKVKNGKTLTVEGVAIE